MFHNIVDGEVEMMVVVHVDDILAYAKDQATMGRFAAELGRKFKLKDTGDTNYYMECHIKRDRKARQLKLEKHVYEKSTGKKFGVEKANRIPASSGVSTLLKEDELQTPEEKEEISKFPYREAVGALMWIATMERKKIGVKVHAIHDAHEGGIT